VAASQAAEAADALAKHYQERADQWYDRVLHLTPKEE
jgi:hypothetical protein